MKIKDFLTEIKLPRHDSHKGQNGKLLIIGGSELFHAASKWSLDVASHLVDMVFYSSVPSNNELIREAKSQFWNGIVVPRDEAENYLQEADAAVIGPGMERSRETTALVNRLLQKNPDKKWVVDAGAVQMVDPQLLTSSCIITPHQRELTRLFQNSDATKNLSNEKAIAMLVTRGVTILLKGEIDHVYLLNNGQQETVAVAGGNAGMTKGGTGDVLAGLVGALYCLHSAQAAAVVGSYVNKKAGELLYQTRGPFFNASDLVDAVPRALWEAIGNGITVI